MRLEKIKLAGFKSFVDPTTVPFPSNLVGVVGPNGCGKSNVIDAVRWVMGESSARLLRGESMADVIFNGSSGRKPVGTASIELLFDNSAGRAGGQYARYQQIAVKRQLSRDGQSAYFLNGTRCRRRDIQDLFLGTGLGPRSYAIIEQGMISRFIEARPEELRLFIEEAAGISRYKERRRETENRMHHTRDNLARLDDLREEVAKQLQHLERQAATAARYRSLKEEERRLEDELAALQWQALAQELATGARALAAAQTAAEADRAELRRLEAEIEAQRTAQADAADAFNAVQGRYYAIGAEIARLEQALRFAAETRERHERDLGRVARELASATDLVARDQAEIADLDAALAADDPRETAARTQLTACQDQVQAAEQAQEAWQGRWDDSQAQVAAAAAEAQRARADINHLEQGLEQDQRRAGRIDEELARLDDRALEERLVGLEERSDGLDERLHLAADAQARAAGALREAEQARRDLAARLDAARTELQTTRGRQASLEALQDAALDSSDAAIAAWIDAQGLQDAPRLLDLIEVAPGWERAVEAVLGPLLGALCVDDPPALAASLPAAAAGALTLVARNGGGLVAAPAGTLAEQVAGPAALIGLLAAVVTVDDLPAALARLADGPGRPGPPGQRLVTRAGLLLGQGWISTPALGPQLAGSIGRAEELKALQQAADELDEIIIELGAEQQAQASQRQRLEQDRDDALEQVARLSRERAALDAELGAGRARLEHLCERRATLLEERQELATRAAEVSAAIAAGRTRLHQALAANESLAAARDALSTERERLRTAVQRARDEEQHWREAAQALHVAAETRRAQRGAMAANLARAAAQATVLTQRRDELAELLEAAAEPAADDQDRLQEQLQRQLAVEAELAATRTRMEACDQAVRAAEQQRHQVDQRLATAQAGLDTARLARQELLVRQRTLEEQLGARGADPQALLAALVAHPSAPLDLLAAAAADPAAGPLDRWRAELAAVQGRIARLGNINLAAIDEFAEQSERKRYLDAQHEDISASLATLEAAIRKIDRETRQRFKETFDRVDQGLKDLFPRVFGGGQAYLELTGEDLLETGVTIMARPPGKRNSSIHLLSGGEKALTAVALVFAIFQLNPAPFCLLDEVDAPLDEANVGRFCDLVRGMSQQVQFIFISHNKVTMEMADHLLGVTMHEPGVSRLVSVDVDAAVRLAAVS